MDDAESKAELVYRYMSARRRLRGVPFEPADVDGVKRAIREARECVVLGSICIDRAGVIVSDEGNEQNHKFFQAIFEGRDDTIDLELGCLRQWREYVFSNGPYPSCPDE